MAEKPEIASPIQEFAVDSLQVRVFEDRRSLIP